MSIQIIAPRRTAKKQEDVHPMTWRIKQLLDLSREGEKIELETDDDKKYIVDKFSHKGVEVIIGRFEVKKESDSGIVSNTYAFKGFGFVEENGMKYNLETPLLETKHEAGKIIIKYINAFRKQRV